VLFEAAAIVGLSIVTLFPDTLTTRVSAAVNTPEIPAPTPNGDMFVPPGNATVVEPDAALAVPNAVEYLPPQNQSVPSLLIAAE
jgi:hypothetical protein